MGEQEYTWKEPNAGLQDHAQRRELCCVTVAPMLTRRVWRRRRPALAPSATEPHRVFYLPVIGIFLILRAASSDFTSVTVSTPFLKEALTLSSCTSTGSGICRSKRP